MVGGPHQGIAAPNPLLARLDVDLQPDVRQPLAHALCVPSREGGRVGGLAAKGSEDILTAVKSTMAQKELSLLRRLRTSLPFQW